MKTLKEWFIVSGGGNTLMTECTSFHSRTLKPFENSKALLQLKTSVIYFIRPSEILRGSLNNTHRT